jgi:hypothetical protein
MAGIKAVQASCDAEIEDMTVTPAAESDETVMEAPMVVTEVPIEVEGVKLELYDLPAKVAKGEVVYFKGKLTENGKGKAKAKITIREHDRTFLMDEVLVKDYTEEDGSFYIGWEARRVDMWDDTAEIYAQYDRDQKPKHLRSEIKSIVIK